MKSRDCGANMHIFNRIPISRVRHRWFPCLLWIVALLFASTMQTVIASEARIDVTMLPPCSKEPVAPYFLMEIRAEGVVRYFGAAQTRVLGMRQVGLDRSQFLSIKAAADNVLARAPKLITEHVNNSADDLYCLEVSVWKDNVAKTTRVSGDSRLGHQLVATIDAATDLWNWVCPLRRLPHLSVAGIYGYCGNPAIFIGITNDLACGSYHEIQVFLNGAVHYSVTRSDFAAGRYSANERVADEYRQISRTRVEYLVNEARELPVTAQLFDGGPKSRGELKDVLQLKEAIVREAQLQWKSVPNAENESCRRDLSGFLQIDGGR